MRTDPLRDVARDSKRAAAAQPLAPRAHSSGKNSRRGKVLAAATALLVLGFWVPAQADDKKVQDAVRMVDDVVAQGPFRASWESLETYTVPDWYLDAKFGIFIHWGVYSVPAFDNEWYPRNMYLKDKPVFEHHIATYGPQSQFGYKDFIPKFKGEKFDANHWAELFRKAGARYVVPVAEHHDGFPMYDCSFTDWSAAKMGPRRDIVGELAAAVRKHGLHFGASSHRAEHWWFFNGGMTFDSDVKEPRFAGLYAPAQPDKTQPDKAYLDDWLARTAELVDKYQPEVLWFDWWIEQPVFSPTCSDSPPTTTTAARNGNAASPSTTNSRLSLSEPQCWISSAGNWIPRGPCSGKPTLP